MDSKSVIDELIPKFAPSSLDVYRNQATFDWRQFKLKLLSEDIVKYQNELTKLFENDPIFDKKHVSLTLDEYRSITFKRIQKLLDNELVKNKTLLENPLRQPASASIIGSYDWSLMARQFLLYNFCIAVISGLGTKQHKDIIEKFKKREITGCFCLTEMSHGTNTKSMRTTATFCKEKQGFYLNTPDFEASKAWVGNLGKSATHAIVYAQLITPDGQCHGLHSFIVPIRDIKNLKPFSGVTIGDMGEKIGLNGIDNGFMMFDQYFIAKESLLNKNGGVTSQGIYKSPFKDPNKRFGASLGALSSGRIGIMQMANTNLTLAVVIALRYSASRKQFGPKDGEELPIIEYQMQHCRLIPYLAAAYVHKIFHLEFFLKFIEFNIEMMMGNKSDEIALAGQEIHAISSCGKPICSWIAQSGIQECREACGGHGYLKFARFGELRNDNDANCTYEGDNNVLLQQTSNYLISLWNKLPHFESKYCNLEFLNEINKYKDLKLDISESSLEDPETSILIYKKLLIGLLKASAQSYKYLENQGQTHFEAKNSSQMYLARTLSIVYVEYLALTMFISYVKNNHWTQEEARIFNQIGALYGIWRLEKHAIHLNEFDIFQQSSDSRKMIKCLVNLCKNLLPNAISLVDVLAPPDSIINSPLGYSDGKIYKHMKAAFEEAPDCYSRSNSWKDIIQTFSSKL